MIALFALTFGLTALAVAALSVGRLWNAAPLRSCRCDGEAALPACITCPRHREAPRERGDPVRQESRGDG